MSEYGRAGRELWSGHGHWKCPRLAAGSGWGLWLHRPWRCDARTLRVGEGGRTTEDDGGRASTVRGFLLADFGHSFR